MYSLKKSEEAICRLADTDPAAAEALGLLSVRYSDAELAHTLLIGAIYIERRNDQVWQLAMRGHISESTAYRYRKRYIATFYHFEMPAAISWLIPWGLLGTIVMIEVLAVTICRKKPRAGDE